MCLSDSNAAIRPSEEVRHRDRTAVKRSSVLPLALRLSDGLGVNGRSERGGNRLHLLVEPLTEHVLGRLWKQVL